MIVAITSLLATSSAGADGERRTSSPLPTVRPIASEATDSSPQGSAERDLESSIELFEEPHRESLRLAAAAAVQAGADIAVVAEVTRRAHERDLRPTEVVAMFEHTRRIGDGSLPVQPVMDRYLQGIAKGIPMARIQLATDQLELRLREAARHFDAVLGEYHRSGDPPARSGDPAARSGDPADPVRARRMQRLRMIDHIAYALGAGVAGGTLDRSLAMVASDQEPVSEVRGPVLAIGCLVAGGVQNGRAMELVEAAWQHSFRGENLVRLGWSVVGLGNGREGPADDMVGRILMEIRQGETREAVFQHLDAMSRGMGPGYQPPGTSPGDDPGHMRRPGEDHHRHGDQEPPGHGGGEGGGHGNGGGD